jgi:hypothetical protein
MEPCLGFKFGTGEMSGISHRFSRPNRFSLIIVSLSFSSVSIPVHGSFAHTINFVMAFYRSVGSGARSRTGSTNSMLYWLAITWSLCLPSPIFWLETHNSDWQILSMPDKSQFCLINPNYPWQNTILTDKSQFWLATHNSDGYITNIADKS